MDAALDDVTGLADLLDPDDYAASQVFGAQRRAAGLNGLTCSSLRYPGSQCIAAFWPDVVPVPTQGGHFAYHWNGAARTMSNGWIQVRFSRSRNENRPGEIPIDRPNTLIAQQS